MQRVHRRLAASGLVFTDNVYDIILVAKEVDVTDDMILVQFARLLEEGRRFTFDAFQIVTRYFDHRSPYMALFLEYAHRQLGDAEWERLGAYPFAADHPIHGIVKCPKTRALAKQARGGCVLETGRDGAMRPYGGWCEPVMDVCDILEEALKRLQALEESAA